MKKILFGLLAFGFFSCQTHVIEESPVPTEPTNPPTGSGWRLSPAMIRAMVDSGGMVINWGGGGTAATTRAAGGQEESLDLLGQVQAMQQLLPAGPETREGLGPGSPNPNMPADPLTVVAVLREQWDAFSIQVEPRLYVKNKGNALDLTDDWDNARKKTVYDKFWLDKSDRGDSIQVLEGGLYVWKYTRLNGTWKMRKEHADSKNPTDNDVILAIDRYWPVVNGDADAVWTHSQAPSIVDQLYIDRKKWLDNAAEREKGYKTMYQEVDKLRSAYSTFVKLHGFAQSTQGAGAMILLSDMEEFVKDNFGINDVNTGVYDNKPIDAVYTAGKTVVTKKDSTLYINTYGKLIYDDEKAQAVMLERNILAAQQEIAPDGGTLPNKNATYTSSVSPRGKLFDFYFGNITAAPEFDHSDPEGAFPSTDPVVRTFDIVSIDDGGTEWLGSTSGTGGAPVVENIKTQQIKSYRVEEATASDKDDYMEWRWELRPGNTTSLIIGDVTTVNTMGDMCEVTGKDKGTVTLVAVGVGEYGVVYEIPIEIRVEVPDKFYVSNHLGNDNNNGYDVGSACASVRGALASIEKLRSFVTQWPTGQVATIIIDDVVQDSNADTLVNISTPGVYPPITLRSVLPADNWSGTTSGVLKQETKPNVSTVVLVVAGGNTVTLGEGLTLTGGSDTVNANSGSGGVVVQGQRTTLTIDGAEIFDNMGYHGGGVFVDDGAICTMKKGTINGNRGFLGGGVYVGKNATFNLGVAGAPTSDMMRPVGVIKSNTTIYGDGGAIGAQGGGVYVATSGTFMMYDGGIVNNATSDPGKGGGVYVARRATFSKARYGILNSQADSGIRGNTAAPGTGGTGNAIYNENYTAAPNDEGPLDVGQGYN